MLLRNLRIVVREAIVNPKGQRTARGQELHRARMDAGGDGAGAG